MALSRPTATAIGFFAVLLWSTLATLTAAGGTVPPFQLLAMRCSPFRNSRQFPGLELAGYIRATFSAPAALSDQRARIGVSFVAMPRESAEGCGAERRAIRPTQELAR